MNSISVAMSPQIYVYYGMADLGYFNRERGGEGRGCQSPTGSHMCYPHSLIIRSKFINTKYRK